MEVTYRRNLQKSYMCVKEQEEPAAEYELNMLKAEHVPYLLELDVVESDGEKNYLYDISGKQQMEDYLSGKKMGYEMLWKLLNSVRELCSVLPDYLLRENGICLKEEYIYVNLGDGSLSFTYLPFWNESLQDAFARCMEQILRKIDHQDQAATELAYQIYQMSVMENVSIRKMLENIKVTKGQTTDNLEFGERRQETVYNNDSEEIMEHAVSEEEKKQNKIVQGIWKKADEMPWLSTLLRYVPFHPYREEVSGDKFLKEKASGDKFLKEENRKRISLKETVFQKKFIKERLLKKKFPEKKPWKEGLRNKETWEEKPFVDCQEVLPPEKTAGERELSYPTEILCTGSQEPMGKLIYQGIHGCGDILVEGEEFLVGKNRYQAAGVIEAEGISRIHARISKLEGVYYLEDLNSTNGTYLNGEPMAYHQKRKLSKNDRILFGPEEYLFS